ncbi:hypothetical protein ACQPYE_26710 [Actinosynnema sp. CA-299493]
MSYEWVRNRQQMQNGPFKVSTDELLTAAKQAVLADPATVDLVSEVAAEEIETILTSGRALASISATGPLRRIRASARKLHSILSDAAGDALPAEQLALPIDEWEVRPSLRALLVAARDTEQFVGIEQEWRAQREAAVTAIARHLRATLFMTLNNARGKDYSTTMHAAPVVGLTGRPNPSPIPVSTDAVARIEAMIRDRRGGSIGVAGPRGVGKTTFLRHFTADGGPTGARRGVMVSAPVEYDAREFVLYLHAELCKMITGATEPAKALPKLPPNRDMPLATDMLAVAAAVGGLGLLTLAVLRRVAQPAREFADLGAGLLLLSLVVSGVLGASGFSAAGSLRSWSRVAAWTAAATFSGGLVLFLGNGAWGPAASQVMWALGLLVVPLTVFALRKQLARRRAEHPVPVDKVVATADNHFRDIRYQQSFTTERTMTVKLANGAVPLGLDRADKAGATLTERPKGLPDLVEDLIGLITTISEQWPLIVGIDELDKLRSAAKAEEFLNDIKGIFRERQCVFLVSVSDDAAAGFERRGVPFRDVFDSTFDDVITLRHLDLAASRDVLYRLLPQWTEPFIAFCHVWSGGLARDLVRGTGQLLDHRDVDGNVELAAVIPAICRREVGARVDAICHELLRDPTDKHRMDLLAEIEKAYGIGDPESWLDRHRALQAWADTHDHDAAAAAPVTLARELAGFVLLARTVLDFFDTDAVALRLQQATRDPTHPLEAIAVARRTLAVTPKPAIDSISRFRSAWGFP